MNRDNEQSLRDVLRGFIANHHYQDRWWETEIRQRWEELAGKEIDLKTQRIRFRQGKLTIFLKSSVLRAELQQRRSAFLTNLNQRLRERPVKELEIR